MTKLSPFGPSATTSSGSSLVLELPRTLISETQTSSSLAFSPSSLSGSHSVGHGFDHHGIALADDVAHHLEIAAVAHGYRNPEGDICLQVGYSDVLRISLRRTQFDTLGGPRVDSLNKASAAPAAVVSTEKLTNPLNSTPQGVADGYLNVGGRGAVAESLVTAQGAPADEQGRTQSVGVVPSSGSHGPS